MVAQSFVFFFAPFSPGLAAPFAGIVIGAVNLLEHSPGSLQVLQEKQAKVMGRSRTGRKGGYFVSRPGHDEGGHEGVVHVAAHDQKSRLLRLLQDPVRAALVRRLEAQLGLPELPQLRGGAPPGLVDGVHLAPVKLPVFGLLELHLDHYESINNSQLACRQNCWASKPRFCLLFYHVAPSVVVYITISK